MINACCCTSASRIAIPNVLRLSLSPSSAFVNACNTGSAPPCTLLNDATSPAKVANFCDKSADPSAVNSIPWRTAPDCVKSPSNSNAANPALLAKLSTKFDNSGNASPNVVSKADRASFASEARLTISLPAVAAAAVAIPRPAAVALPIPAATLPNLLRTFDDLVMLSVNCFVLPIIAIDTFLSLATCQPIL